MRAESRDIQTGVVGLRALVEGQRADFGASGSLSRARALYF